MMHHSKFNEATELTRPKSVVLCHLVDHSATCVWDQSSWHRWAATASTACVVQLGAVADWWCHWPMANTLACLCSCHRHSFGTYFVTINLFSLCLTHFIFHTMFGAASDVLRVHYKSMKCDVSFSQGSVSTIFRRDGHFSCLHKEISSGLIRCKNYKNRLRFSKVMITDILPPFSGSQCCT